MIGRSPPELWGGEVAAANQMSTNCGQNKGNGLTDTQTPHKTPSKQYYNFIAKSNTSQSNSDNGIAAQTIILSTEQPTNGTLGTHNESTLAPVKSTTEHLTIPELLGRVKSYDNLPPGWKNVEAIADVAIGTQVQVYNLVSRQWQPGVVKDYWEPGGFLEVRCGRRVQKVFSGECVAVESGEK
ncbi:hypothetical protein H6G97_39260 [Nostoc flagelliforme FACHB-838]|uniref:Uncharacterized protein n=1 Tax=Nostoc flagelliforme FACHB-838 TaxID=2692904 RepID=A0ABR8E1L2_9NOSO|nr:hypothetical protein [Nostoc flagelliforme]MBD2535130.1 hypothetical protein [Nostoc flagelliforme FACHB-838]